MYLVIGSDGQLGKKIKSILGDKGVYTNREQIDITNEKQIIDFIYKKNFKAIINCSAYTAVDKAETDIENAVKVNVDGVRNLAKTNIPLIHISTDYVFDGKKNIPYIESDKPNPMSIYGKTKFDGEKEVLKYCKTCVIIRTSWLYSEYGNNFVKTILRLGKEKNSLNVIFDQIGTPTYAEDLAKVILNILQNLKDNNREIYNFSNEGVCSWYDFATKIIDIANLNCKINPIESKDYPSVATRPFFSVLNKAKIKKDFNININHWEVSLHNCLNKMINKMENK